MDRVSGWYKRYTLVVVFLAGFLGAVAINADTIAIATSLSRDSVLREAVVAATQEYAKPSAQPVVADPTSDIAACRTDRNSPECRVAANLSQVGSLGLPLGWNPNDPRSVPTDGRGWLMKVLGLLMTAVAVSLGAPFWFDLLNKVSVIRATVKPQEKSPQEPAVDRP
jgi:hypothetical protein